MDGIAGLNFAAVNLRVIFGCVCSLSHIDGGLSCTMDMCVVCGELGVVPMFTSPFAAGGGSEAGGGGRPGQVLHRGPLHRRPL